MILRQQDIRFSDGNQDKPGIFFAQFRCNEEPWLNAHSCAVWANAQGYGAAQIPAWDSGLVGGNLDEAAKSKDFVENEIIGPFTAQGVQVAHFANHLRGQCIAINPTLRPLFEGFVREDLRNAELTVISDWASSEMKKTLQVAAHAGHKIIFAFSGSFLWPFVYPWPQRPTALVKVAMKELARRWLPILDLAESLGLKIAFELHPGEDIFDGRSFEMFLEAVNNHPACCIGYDPSHFMLMGLDYIDFIHKYHDRIVGYHVKDAELRSTGSQGVYSGLETWENRAGRFRSLGDGMVDLKAIDNAMQEHGLSLWRIMEWECCVKGRHQGAAEGAKVIQAIIDSKMIPRFPKVIPHNDVFDAFAGVKISKKTLERCLGFTIPDEDAIALGLAA